MIRTTCQRSPTAAKRDLRELSQPGKAHAKGVDATSIFDPTTAKEMDNECQACHGSERANFKRSAHGRGNVSCISCHTIHAPAHQNICSNWSSPSFALSATNDVKPQFSMPFHHKV